MIQARIAANTIAPYFPSTPQKGLYPLQNLSRQFDSRLLAVDSTGKVLLDTVQNTDYHQMNLQGKRLVHPEVLSALKGLKEAQLHRLADNMAAVYAAAPVVSGNQVQGALLLSHSLINLDSILSVLIKKIITAMVISSILALYDF